jgi:hypothetical protein
MTDVFGTDADQDLIGTTTDDRLYGYGGKDRLYGKGGDDQLYGGAGDDLLDGGADSDIMFGGSGNDTYRVDDAEDIVSEETVAGVDDGGIDTVQSSITFSLGRFLENLALIGTAAIDGTGNDVANRITGNAAANTLTGGRGNDTLNGGAGDDRLVGGADKDTLTGGTGSDTFVFGPAAAASTDTVTDFAAEDWVGILASDFGLRAGSGLVDDGTGKLVLDAGYFATVSGASNVQGTASGHGQFVFNTTTRSLMWDADGAATGASGIALATFNAGAVLTAADFAIDPTPMVGNISIDDVTITEGNSGTKTATFTVSRTGTAAFAIDFATAGSTATAGSDYVARSGTLTFAAGQAAQTVSVTINCDTAIESQETFFVNLANATNGGTIVDEQGLGTISNDDAAPAPAPSSPTVVKIHDMRAIGSTDPAALAYVPHLQTLYVADSEVDETPFSRPNNLFQLRTDGTATNTFSLSGVTNEPAGLAFDPVTGYLFISDDDKLKVFWVDPANPTVKRGEFLTNPLGVVDPEDIAVDPRNGHLFVANGTGNSTAGGPLGRAIVETNSTGTQVFSTITLPSVISDPEALAYDAREDVFYVGGGFSANIWKVDRSGAILSTIDLLSGYRNPLHNGRVNVKDLELAPSSDPNDHSANLSLYVADYGNSHVDDGRLFEINLGDWLWA